MSGTAVKPNEPIRSKPFPPSITIGEEEVEAAIKVLRTGLLSGFVGSPSPEFFGGPTVRAFEAAWSERFKAAHSVSCNSATSALIMAVGAIGIGPGDEVIVSPYTMSATAISILFYGGIPVFADIESDFFCLDPKSIEQRITSRTKAIITTDIHGQPSAMKEILKIAADHNLFVITDTAQAPGATYYGKYAGTIGHIGIFSLNRHKNIQCGEGGVACTNDDELALRMKLIRNHGENLVEKEGFKVKSLANLIGFNFRMTEVEAAIAHEQLKKLDKLNGHRIELAEYLNERLRDNPLIAIPKVRPGCTHVFYMHVPLFRPEVAKVTRAVFIDAIRAEGIPIWGGYLKPLYLEAVFQRQIAIGENGFPFVGAHYDGKVNYNKGLCPVAEDLYQNRTIINPFLYPPLTLADMKDIGDAFDKVTDDLK
ncbi:MAG: DegT/DnrJ/EryC1/StrS family aminotransferase [Methylovirgula sp.]